MDGKRTELAPGFVTLYESPDPQRIFAYSPGIARVSTIAGTRLVATLDLGAVGGAELSGRKNQPGEKSKAWQGHVYSSDDGNLITFHRIKRFRELVY
ncbi:MAG: hypothetical protein ABR497_11790 [Kiritimatiellia bacterium]|nr:hypothetical protein [Lentisphaerota bacterium]